jgi:hypothetical protein
MAIKGDYQSLGLMLPSVCKCLTDDLLVAQMHTIENSNRQTDLRCLQRELVRGVLYDHSLDYFLAEPEGTS